MTIICYHVHHVNERFKNKNKTNSRHTQIDDIAHKKYTVWRQSQKEDFLLTVLCIWGKKISATIILWKRSF